MTELAADDTMALADVARLLDSGRIADAEAGLTSILERRPRHAQALHLMGILRLRQQRIGDAERALRASLACDPGQPRVHVTLGNVFRSTGRMPLAAEEFRAALRLKANDAEAHLALALALSELGDHASAEKSCREALRYQPNYLLARQALATELCLLGRAGEAETLLRRTLAPGVRDPRQAAALEHALGLALKQQDRFEAALVLFDAAQAKAPDMPAVDINRAGTLQQLGRIAEAAQAYARAAARDPSNADAQAGLALMSALTGDLVTARTAAIRALETAPHPLAEIALCIAEIEEGAADAAMKRLATLLASPSFAADHGANFSLGFVADVLDRQGHFAQAFALYRASNANRRRLQERFEPVRAVRDVERLSEQFARCVPSPASAAGPTAGAGAAARHVFVLGFMRSGTTLLQTVLSTDPNVVSIDEVEFLTEPAREFLLTKEGLDRLAGLSPAEALAWRDRYWRAVRSAGINVEGKTFIDKMPFNALRLPLIARLFPDAKVVFCLRDPRDVVFSCFRRRFNPGPFSYEFFDLADCARFYAASMALATLYRSRLPLAVHDHRYEAMVADFDATIGAVCAFTGIAWNASMRDFTRAAEEVDHRSASAAQVRRGLYAEGAGHWRHYSEQLAPIMPILEPWLARFGYREP